MPNNIIARGAEAIIIKDGKYVIKNRIPKNYRLKLIDEKIRNNRTKKEAKLLEKVSSLIKVPKLIKIKKTEIDLEFIKGKKLSENLDNLENKEEICKDIGEEVEKLHSHSIIHGDLTTSNLILVYDKIFFIDFGLGFHSTRIEDKAVDIHVFKEALEAKHYKHAEKLWKAFLNGYEKGEESKKVLEQLKKVEARGRYRF